MKNLGGMEMIMVAALALIILAGTGAAVSLSNSGGGTWKYQREISIKENSGTTLTDYQVLIELKGADFPGEAKSDGADVRFTDSKGNELNNWIESWDNAARSAKIWVKIPSISAGSSTVIRMHYGNPGASVISKGDKVFDFFDDFEYSDSVTNHGWGNTDTGCVLQTTSTDWATSGTRSMKIVHTVDVVCGIIRQVPIPTPFLITYDAKQTQTSTASIFVSSATDSDWRASGTAAESITLPYAFTVFTKYDYTNPVTYTGSYNYPAIFMGQSTSHSSATAYIDNFRVRKYASPEPTVTLSPPSSLTIATPVPVPTSSSEICPTSSAVLLHGEKTDVVLGEDILLKLSAVNLITKPLMSVQVMIYPPSGMSVTGFEFVKSGAGIYTTNYTLNPGDGKDIEVHIKSNQIGDFNVKGRIVYYFGEEKDKAEDCTLNLPIKVRKEFPPTQEPVVMSTPGPVVTTKIPGFEGIIGISGLLFVLVLIKRGAH